VKRREKCLESLQRLNEEEKEFRNGVGRPFLRYGKKRQALNRERGTKNAGKRLGSCSQKMLEKDRTVRKDFIYSTGGEGRVSPKIRRTNSYEKDKGGSVRKIEKERYLL